MPCEIARSEVAARPEELRLLDALLFASAEPIDQAALAKRMPDGVDVSIGCVAVPPETSDLDPLIDQADREMYRRKRALAS